MAKPPTPEELFATVDHHVHLAGALLTHVVFQELNTGCFMSRREGDAVLRHLYGATAAMQALHCQLRGVPSPKYGDT